MDDMDDTVSSSLIDALTTFCKTRLDETGMLELIDGDEINDLLDKIKDGRITAEEYGNISDPSLIWSAIIKGFEAAPIFTVTTTNSSPDDVVHRLSDSYKRACGPLLCTAELLLEYFPHNSAVIVASLQKAFISSIVLGHSNATSFLLHLVEEYKMYFPYSYTFCRRIGKSPNITLQDWKDTFFPSSSNDDKKESGGDLNVSGIQDFSLDNWDLSGLEEGEDSDDDSHQRQPRVPTVRTKKSTTRMRKKATASTNRNSSDTADRAKSTPNLNNENALQLLQDNPADTSVDSFIEVQELMSVSREEDSFIKGSPQRISPSKMKDVKDRDKIDVSLDLDEEKITQDDLKAVFEQSLEVGEFLAQKGKLSRNLKYNSDVPSLAQAVMRFHDTELSWDELQELAIPFVTENRRTLASSFDTDTSDLDLDVPPLERNRSGTVILAAPQEDWSERGAPTMRKSSRKNFKIPDDEGNDEGNSSGRTFKSDWSNTRTHQNFLVDSIEIEREVKGTNKDFDNKQNKEHSSQQLSPYLSLPKQPPTMGLVQEGELLFQEIDRDGDGIVSKIELIKALKVNSPLAKRLKLSQQIRQEDGTRDDFMGVFHAMDKDSSADISIEEFISFLNEQSVALQEQEKDEDKNKVATPVKSSVTKTGNSGQGSRDSWAVASTSVAENRSPPPSPALQKQSSISVPDRMRLSTTSEDILDHIDNNRSLVVPKRSEAAGKSSQRYADSKDRDDEGTAQDNIPVTTERHDGTPLRDIPKPKYLQNTDRNDSGSVFDIDVDACMNQDDDKSDSFDKGRIDIKPALTSEKDDAKRDGGRGLGSTAKKYLEMHKKAKSERVLSKSNVKKVNVIDTNSVSKSLDRNIIPPENLLDMQRSHSENTGVSRPPLPLHASLTATTNAKISSFHIRRSLSDGIPPGEDSDVSGVTPSCLPPPQTELGDVMGVVLEGWLEKKSTVTGLFQKRFVVLAFGKVSHMIGGLSSTNEDVMELRIFKRAVESAWGYAPIELKRVIAMDSVESVEAHANKKKIDSIFTLTERMVTVEGDSDAKNTPQPLTSGVFGTEPGLETGISKSKTEGTEGFINARRSDSFNSVNSDHHWAGKARVVTLRASNPEMRLLWVTTLQKAMSVHRISSE